MTPGNIISLLTTAANSIDPGLPIYHGRREDLTLLYLNQFPQLHIIFVESFSGVPVQTNLTHTVLINYLSQDRLDSTPDQWLPLVDNAYTFLYSFINELVNNFLQINGWRLLPVIKDLEGTVTGASLRLTIAAKLPC